MKAKNEMLKLWKSLNWIKQHIRPFLPGLAMIILLNASGALTGVATAVTSKYMIDYAVADKLSWAGLAAAIFGGLIVMNLLMGVGRSLLAVRIQEQSSNTLRQQIFQKLQMTEWLPLSAYHSGDLVTRLTSDVNNLTNCLANTIPGIIALVVQLLASFFTLLHFAPELAILAFVLGPATVLFSRVWGRKLKYMYIKVQESESSYRAFIQEVIQKIVVIKSFRLEKFNELNLQGLQENHQQWILKRNRLNLAADNVIALGYWAGYLLAFSWSIVRLAQKAITYGTLTVFLQLVQQVQAPFIGLAKTLPQVIAMFGAIERLRELEKIPAEKPTEQVPELRYLGLSFKQVSFAYSPGKIVLDKASTEILPGELVALVGPSGQGKTTLARLLLALLRPSGGEVNFTDCKGGCYAASVATRDWIAYVPQGNTLFSGTIADNLRSGKPDATMEEMEKAARAACAWSFIQELPQGFDTRIGEYGHGLSEGQAQRIAIARALLRKAPVLVLDEATSALDTDTEMNVLKAIKDLNHTCTCLVITHRLSALRICSRLLRIRDRKLIEEKNEDMLLEA